MTESNVPFRIRRGVSVVAKIDKHSHFIGPWEKDRQANWPRSGISKSQIPSSKETSIAKTQSRQGTAPLNIEDWNLFGIWSLGFGASSLAEAS
jgi:hypothetical protein